ncbi:hypothetical protein [Klebsiella michiganensis]|uniref:hypothetical protein n=1 Tax=Klebsiella michiganensis TaxID=1134687 RepID=UPI00374B91E1
MRIILDTIIDNDELPFIEPAMQLIRPSSLAVFDMQSLRDISGKSSLEFSGTFNSQGAAVDASTFLNTNVAEVDDMTLIYCWNLSVVGTNQLGLGNRTPASVPFSGISLSKQDTTTALYVSTGLSSPASVTVGGNFLGAWTVQAITVSASQAQRITKSGTVTQSAITSRAKSSIPLYINGIPAGISSPVSTGGIGTVGFFCAYNEILSATDAMNYMGIISSIMAARGVSV